MKKATYKSSGVDIHKANAFVRAIKGDVTSTLDSSVLQRKGAFGGLYALANGRYKNPVLVSSTDGAIGIFRIARLCDVGIAISKGKT